MSMLPGSGELTRRITIRLWSDVPNMTFGVDQVFDVGITRWAKREPVHGIAIRAGMNTEEVPTDLFWVRYGSGSKPESITTAHVIDWNGRRYRVLNAINVGDAQRFTRISAKDLGAIV